MMNLNENILIVGSCCEKIYRSRGSEMASDLLTAPGVVCPLVRGDTLTDADVAHSHKTQLDA